MPLEYSKGIRRNNQTSQLADVKIIRWLVIVNVRPQGFDICNQTKLLVFAAMVASKLLVVHKR